MTFSYGLFYPEYYHDKTKAETMFYFGIGTDINRPNQHIYKARNCIEANPHKNNVIREIERNGYKVLIRYFYGHATREDACMFEIATLFLMPQLTNITMGGDGAGIAERNPMYDKKHTTASKAKMRQSQSLINRSGNNNPMYGKKHKLESIEQNRQTNRIKHLGKNNPMYGRTHTIDAIRKMRKAALKREAAKRKAAM